MRHLPDLNRISETVAASFGVREVYGEPVERDGVLVIPAARVWSSGGAGAGGPDHEVATGHEVASVPDSPDDEVADPSVDGAGSSPGPDGGGGGIGFGRWAEPIGAFVVEGQDVRWVPAVSVNRIVLGGQVALVLVAAVVGWAVARRRRG